MLRGNILWEKRKKKELPGRTAGVALHGPSLSSYYEPLRLGVAKKKKKKEKKKSKIGAVPRHAQALLLDGNGDGR